PDLIDSAYYQYGQHDLILLVNHPNYSAQNISLPSYTIKAPYVEAILDLSEDAVEEGDTIIVQVKARNIGTAVVDNMSVELQIEDSDVAVFLTNNEGSIVCKYLNAMEPTASYVVICEYAIKGVSEGDTAVKIDTASDDSFYSAAGYKDMKFLSESRESFEVVQPTTTTEESSSSTTYYTTTEEEEDDESEEQEEEPVENVKPELSIIVPSEINITYPNSTEISITIVNKGEEDITLTSQNIEFVYDEEALNISYLFNKVTLAPGNKYVFKAVITPLDVGKYVIGIRVKIGSYLFHKEITAEVYPDDTKKKEILQKYEELKEKLNQLKDEADDSAKNVLSSLELKLENVSYYLEQENYVEAYSLLKEVEEELQNLNIQVGEEEKKGNSWIWWILLILLIIILIVAAVFYYLWVPEQSGFDPAKGYYYVPPVQREERKNYLQKFSEMIKKKLGLKPTIEERYPDLKNKKEEW
ncbi:MAG: hypothetical protein GXN99_01840, partial [Candidatus Nanohaloarchaeota archaeon]|nr:hypothetical protein [Candidatus Nanohaloarchaeota archaeon]